MKKRGGWGWTESVRRSGLFTMYVRPLSSAFLPERNPNLLVHVCLFRSDLLAFDEFQNGEENTDDTPALVRRREKRGKRDARRFGQSLLDHLHVDVNGRLIDNDLLRLQCEGF